jgi:raffinose/stachyose/melibiose transport system substrate-binding protein
MSATHTRREFVQRAGASTVAFSSIGALLSACGSGGGEQLTEGTITLWSDISEASDKAFYRDQVVTPFERDNQGLTVDVSFRGAEDLDRQVRLALQGQEAPDIVPTLGPAFVPELADADLLSDLNPYAEDGGWEETLLPWAVDLGRVNDVLVAIPTQLETLGVFFNRTVFEDHGWDMPKDRGQLEDLADEMMDADIIPFAGGTADLRQQIEWYTSVFFSNTAGPELMYDVLTGKQPWTSAGLVEAVALMQEYFQRGYFGGGVEKFFATGQDVFHAQLADGDAAMDMEGTWFFQEIDQFFGSKAGNESEWDFAAFPSLSDAAPYPMYCLGTGGTLSINEESQLKDGAGAFIGYLIEDPKRTATWLAERGAAFSYPLRFTADDFPASMDPRQRDAYVSLVDATGQGNIGYTNWTFSPPKTAVYIYEEIEPVLTGDTTPEDFCEGAEDTFQEDLDDGFTPRVPSPSA